MNRKSIFVTVSALLLAVLLWFGFVRLFPLESSGLSGRFELWRKGVESWEATASLKEAKSITTDDTVTFRGYEKNDCENEAQCTCVVLIHGMGDDALTWRRILLTERSHWVYPLRLIAPNLLGTGKSSKPEEVSFYRVRTQAEALLSALKSEAKCTGYILVGNSLGGWIATWMAILEPKLIKKLMLVSSAGMKAQTAASKDSASSLLSEPTVEGLKEFQRRAYFKPREIPDWVWEAIVARAKLSNSGAVKKAQVGEDLLDSYLPSLRLPTLLFWGAADRIIEPASGREMARLIPGAQFREAPECGHMPQKECPKALATSLNELVRFGAM